LSKFLLRHDRVWRQDAWTLKHEQWLTGQRFADPALRSTYRHYRAVVAARDAEVAAARLGIDRALPTTVAPRGQIALCGLRRIHGGLDEGADQRRFVGAAQHRRVPQDRSIGDGYKVMSRRQRVAGRY